MPAAVATIPGAAIAGAAIPGGAIAGGAIPAAIPGAAIAADAIPGGAIRTAAIPGGAIPGAAISGGAEIGGGASGGALIGGAISGGAISGGAISGGLIGGAPPAAAGPDGEAHCRSSGRTSCRAGSRPAHATHRGQPLGLQPESGRTQVTRWRQRAATVQAERRPGRAFVATHRTAHRTPNVEPVPSVSTTGHGNGLGPVCNARWRLAKTGRLRG